MADWDLGVLAGQPVPGWIMINDRNLTTHPYSEDTAAAGFSRLTIYLARLQLLPETLAQQLLER